MHDWIMADRMCTMQNMRLCEYEAYCPNGQGAVPFQGGPPKLHNHDTLEETQWSPFTGASYTRDPKGSHWIQIGHLAADKGGSEENGFIQCWYVVERLTLMHHYVTCVTHEVHCVCPSFVIH